MKIYFPYLCGSLLIFSSSLIAQQVISGAATFGIDSTGQSDGVSFINQAVDESALSVFPGNSINSKKHSVGVSTDAANLGIINFEPGSSSTMKTYGTLGSSALPLDTFNCFGNVEFNSNIWVNEILLFGNSSISFQNTLNVGAGNLGYSTGGSVTLAKNGVINGNVGVGFGLGSFTMSEKSVVNGNVAVSDFTLTGSSSTSNPDKFATINGNYGAQITTINSGFTLSVNGDIGFPANSTLELTESFASFPIIATGNVVGTSFSEIRYSFGFSKAPRAPKDPETPVVIDLIAGSSGSTLSPLPTKVITNDSRISMWFAQIVNGTLQIISGSPQSGITPPSTVPTEPDSPWWLNYLNSDAEIAATGGITDIFLRILPDAPLYSGTDTDYVQGQLSAPTMKEYGELLYQLYPAPALIGIAPESFTVTKQFQKVWLEHLYQNRTFCGFTDPDDPCCAERRDQMRVWADGFGYYGRRTNKNPGKGYKVNTKGVTIGAEKTVTPEWELGVGLGYACADLKKSRFKVQSHHTNTTNFNNYQGTLYFSYHPAPWYMDAGLSFGWNRYQGKRHIAFRDINRKPHADYCGQNYSAFLTTGCEFYCNNLQITPLGSMTYCYLHINDYKEKGAESLNLKVRGQNYHFLESGLGIKAAYLFETCCGAFIPEVHTIWLHEFNRNNASVRASFSQDAGTLGGYFRNRGPKVDKDTWNVGASVTCLRNSNLSVMLNYDYELSNHYFDNQGLIELSYIF